MTSQINDLYEFGGCRLDAQGRVLTRNGHPVSLAPKTFELLLLMVRSPGRAFSKEELMKALWRDTFVEEANLSFQTSVLRKALGEEGRWIETIPKYGYRFTADVRIGSLDGQSTAVAATARPHGTAFARLRRRGLAKWFAAIVVASALALTSYGLVLRSRRGAPAAVGVPITTYVGSAAEPRISPDGNRVAFSWGLGGPATNVDIYVKTLGAAGEPQRLTTNPARDSAPAWSPDGRQIAFLRSVIGDGENIETYADLIVIPAEGGVERTVITLRIPLIGNRPISVLDWAPDGQWIAIGGQPSATESSCIWLVTLDGKLRRPLTNVPSDAEDHGPVFSPDGTRLAFLRTSRGTSAGPLTSVHVLPLSPDLSAAGPPTRVVSEERGGKRALAWTPDGSGLVFSSRAGPLGRAVLKRISVTAGPDQPGGEPQLLAFGQGAEDLSVAASGRVVYSAGFWDTAIWKLPLTGLTDRPVALPLLSTPFVEENPDYSRDGKRLAFVSTRSGEQEIWIANADGSSAVQMTSIGGYTGNPRWSPDGQTILFTSRHEGSSDVYMLRVDSRELRRLTDDPGDEHRPRWSQDGRWIYFELLRNRSRDVWKMPADRGAPVQVTKQGGRTPVESPDGRWVYYAKGDIAGHFSIWRMPVEGGEETLVVEGLSYPTNFVVANRGIYFVAVGQSREETSVDFVESGTNARTTIVKLGKAAWYGAALSPDESTMLFATLDASGSNLMLVDWSQ